MLRSNDSRVGKIPILRGGFFKATELLVDVFLLPKEDLHREDEREKDVGSRAGISNLRGERCELGDPSGFSPVCLGVLFPG